MLPQELTFDLPMVLYLALFGLIFIGLFWKLFIHREQLLDRFSKSNAFKKMITHRSTQNFAFQVTALIIAWLCAVIALAGPKGHGKYADADNKSNKRTQVTVSRKAHDIIFLLDTSNSMTVVDAHNGKSRFDYAKEVIDEIVGQLKEGNVSLYTFTSEAAPIVPSTLDYLFLRLMLRKVGINENEIPGTDFLQTIQNIKEVLSKNPEKQKTLIILSDGEDQQIVSMSDSAKGKYISEIVNTLPNAKDRNFHIISVGIGTKSGGIVPYIEYEGKSVTSSLNETILKKLSEVGDGEYYDADDLPALTVATEIVKEIDTESNRISETRSILKNRKSMIIYDYYFQFPLALAIIGLLVSLSIPDTNVKRNEMAKLTQ